MTISALEIKNRLENFQKAVKQHNLPITPQKYEIFRIIASSGSHPRVTEIYKKACQRFPRISLATVYKNLMQFQELGLIVEIPIKGESNRYDAKLDIHGHAVDTAAGLVYDLELDPSWNLPQTIKGKEVRKINLICYL